MKDPKIGDIDPVYDRPITTLGEGKIMPGRWRVTHDAETHEMHGDRPSIEIPAYSPDAPYLSNGRTQEMIAPDFVRRIEEGVSTVDDLIAESTNGIGDLWLAISQWARARAPGGSAQCGAAGDLIDSQIAFVIRKAFELGRTAGLAEAAALGREP